MSFSPLIEMIPKDYYQKIHDASMKALKETGVVYLGDEALETFRKHGAKVDNKIVYFTDKLIDGVIETFKPKFTWTAREPSNTVTVGEGVVVQPSIGPVFVHELDKTRRPGTIKDFINFQKLNQAFCTVNATGTYPVDPSDLGPEEKYIRMMFESLKLTNKPLVGYVNTHGIVKKTLDMVELAVGGKSAFEANHYVGIGVNPLSPLKWGPEPIDTIIEYAKRNQAVFVLPCILAGVSGPISMLECVILQNAEILSGIALAKLVNPGTPVVYAPGSTVAYMKTGSYCTGTPEGMMLNIPNLQMGRDFYKLPTRTQCGMTDSKLADAQAGFETMQNLILGILGGTSIVHEALGTLDSLMAVSFEKYILDIEMIERARRIKAGYEGFDLSLSIEAIQEVGHDDSYIGHDSTYEHFRDRWEPSISVWDDYDTWEKSGKHDIAELANRKWQEVIAAAPDCVIEGGLLKELEAYMSKAI